MLENIVSALYQGQYASSLPVLGLAGNSAGRDSYFFILVL
jgi:hypothetical protein